MMLGIVVVATFLRGRKCHDITSGVMTGVRSTVKQTIPINKLTGPFDKALYTIPYINPTLYNTFCMKHLYEIKNNMHNLTVACDTRKPTSHQNTKATISSGTK